uniref:Uncharacterized protein n=1 Tax=Arundo donax TaxID=35708 RepID=A0A0A8ZG20_ARUDO
MPLTSSENMKLDYGQHK